MINVVGAGLAGSILTTLLRRNGVEVRLFDDNDSRSGSRASSNLYIASWLKKFSGGRAELGLRTLEELYGDVADCPFAEGIGDAMRVRHVPQRHILLRPDVEAAVEMVEEGWAHTERNGSFAGNVVLCTGYRLAELNESLHVDVKVGHAFFFEGQLLPGRSRLALIAPYRHEKLYQFDPATVYYADSTAVTRETYDRRGEELKHATLARAQRHLGEVEPADFRIGYRPFVNGSGGFVGEVQPGVWVLNGGGKNGMAAYAAGAVEILRAIQAGELKA